jgi:hypothetical protein
MLCLCRCPLPRSVTLNAIMTFRTCPLALSLLPNQVLWRCKHDSRGTVRVLAEVRNISSYIFLLSLRSVQCPNMPKNCCPPGEICQVATRVVHQFSIPRENERHAFAVRVRAHRRDLLWLDMLLSRHPMERWSVQPTNDIQCHADHLDGFMQPWLETRTLPFGKSS